MVKENLQKNKDDNKNVCVAIDLLWVRPEKVGGIEAYIRNLLDGFMKLDNKFEFTLFVSKDNAETFKHYKKDSRYKLHICDVESSDVKKRIVWQNLHLGAEIKKCGLRKCFEPYYCKPFLGTSGIDFYTTIHDLQAIHYPKYFSRGKVLWMKVGWKNAVNTSKRVFVISHYVERDILSHYKCDKNKIAVIYNPITVDESDCVGIDVLQKKYGADEKKFFFTVSSLLPHKNLKVLLTVMKEIKDRNIYLPQKLIISGVGGKSKGELVSTINELGLGENVLLTPFISNAERNALYKYCYAFLFPSLFEGFGMPPIEAMKLGAPVVTSKMTSLGEVTCGKAMYVDDPTNAKQWIDVLIKGVKPVVDFDFSKYDITYIASQYLNVLDS